MKCPKCGKDVILQKKQVGVDDNGNPVLNEYAICKDCKKQWNLDKQRAKKAAEKTPVSEPEHIVSAPTQEKAETHTEKVQEKKQPAQKKKRPVSEVSVSENPQKPKKKVYPLNIQTIPQEKSALPLKLLTLTVFPRKNARFPQIQKQE